MVNNQNSVKRGQQSGLISLPAHLIAHEPEGIAGAGYLERVLGGGPAERQDDRPHNIVGAFGFRCGRVRRQLIRTKTVNICSLYVSRQEPAIGL